MGDPVDVIYLPENPDNARIDTWANLGGESVIWSILGAVFVAFGALMWFGFFSLLFGVIGWALSLDSVSLTARGHKTEAVVEYSVNGKTYRNQTHVQDENHPLVRGGRVAVLYDPAKPGRARVDTFDQLWLPTALCGAFAVLLVPASAGTGVWFFVKRKQSRA